MFDILLDIIFGEESYYKDLKKGIDPGIFAFKDPNVRKLIHNLKYRGSNKAANIVFELIKPYIDENSIIIPMPIHRKRWLYRGWNQTELFCKNFKNMRNDILFREYRKRQTKLNRKERLENLKNSFYIKIPEDLKENWANTNFTIVDDVSTTGSSLNEAKLVLEKSGAKNIKIISFAR